MIRIFSIFYICLSLISCGTSKNVSNTNDLPTCLREKMKEMSKDPSQGEPLEVRSYIYSDQTVYYLVAACCDKYNIVVDNNCKVLGYPDGGFTGRGDGSMIDFKDAAKNGKVIWTKKK